MIWNPDTCDCRIKLTNSYRWIETLKVCRLHKFLKNQTLLDEVMAQNRRFNSAFGSIDLSTEQRDLVVTAKKVNQLRIRTESLDNFDEHLPTEQTLTFFQNLKKILRGLNPL